MNANGIKIIMDRVCLGKVDRSKEECDFIVDRKAAKGEVIYYYKCDFCNRYHLTSQDHEPKKNLELI